MGHSLDSAPTATHFTHHYHTQCAYCIYIYVARFTILHFSFYSTELPPSLLPPTVRVPLARGARARARTPGRTPRARRREVSGDG